MSVISANNQKQIIVLLSSETLILKHPVNDSVDFIYLLNSFYCLGRWLTHSIIIYDVYIVINIYYRPHLTLIYLHLS